MDNVIVFDGVCKLCNRCVRFVIERDPDARFRFAALQSAGGVRLLRQHGFDPRNVHTFVLLKGGRIYVRSAAALEIARQLRGPARLLALLRIVPRRLRDRLYDVVARNRYRWFGKLDACVAPAPEVKARFLD